ncbi:hypothetical protein CE91St36_01900 [Christensenellaceae bacterium]|nr:hypothetical protein CE91St36_01900 [Christensenellaceae bacterium]BDF60041.1 hypothetical protein CE91St37_01910 [Christensenellaceae bacterium]
MLEHLQRTLSFAQGSEDGFVRAVSRQSELEWKKERQDVCKALTAAVRRISDIDALFRRLYEDSVSGRITDERFSLLSESYEQEQAKLKGEIPALQERLGETEGKVLGIGNFLALVRRYTRVERLDGALLNEFVRSITVHAPDRSSGKRTQQIDILYNFIGEVPANSFPRSVKAV